MVSGDHITLVSEHLERGCIRLQGVVSIISTSPKLGIIRNSLRVIGRQYGSYKFTVCHVHFRLSRHT